MIVQLVRDASIRNKIIMITFLINLIVVLAMTMLLSLREYQRVSLNFQERVSLEAQIISDHVGPALVFHDEESLKETIQSFYQDQSILAVEVLDAKDYLVFKSVNQSAFGQAEKVITVERKVIVDGENVGTLKIQTFNFQLEKTIQNIINTMLLNLLMALFLAFVLAAFFQRIISKPLLRLYQTAGIIAKTQDYSIRVDNDAKDEVGQLSNMFNQMLDKVEQRDEKLEKLVDQRTLELEKLANEFRHRAFHDTLTGLPNRALLTERFELAMEHAKRCHNKFACLLLDLDNFKNINDTKGHNYGDQLLIEVAHRLRTTVRHEDLVCRLGGDEFVVLLIDLENQNDLEIGLKKIVASLEEKFDIFDKKVKSSVSIGASLYPDHGDDLHAIKRKADVAMYRAKDAGKNRYCVYTPDMQDDVKHRVMIQTDLNDALKEEQLTLYFQPKVSLSEHRVIGCEVLLRWIHPREGFIPPSDFIPFAEESSQIVQIDYYVLNKTFETLARWQKDGYENLALAINLSGRHFTNFDIVEKIREYLECYSVNPKRLEFEITEAVLIEDPEVAQRVVAEIKNLGVRLSLDDFGTGYSSLNYLRTLPIDCIKLDHTFIQRIDINDQDRRLINGIMSLGKGLGLELVAEGVETIEQLEILQRMQCDFVQGYFFLKPVPEQEFLSWLEENFQNNASFAAN